MSLCEHSISGAILDDGSLGDKIGAKVVCQRRDVLHGEEHVPASASGKARLGPHVVVLAGLAEAGADELRAAAAVVVALYARGTSKVPVWNLNLYRRLQTHTVNAIAASEQRTSKLRVTRNDAVDPFE